MRQRTKKTLAEKREGAALIARLDQYANGVKPLRVKSLLETACGLEVDVVNPLALGRAGEKGWKRLLPDLTERFGFLYLLEASRQAVRVAGRLLRSRAVRHCDGLLLAVTIRERALLLRRRLQGAGYRVIICESLMDEAVFSGERLADVQVLDLPAPFVDELYFGGLISDRRAERLRRWEAEWLESADLLSFHWHTYQEYFRCQGYSGSNLFSCAYGVEAKTVRAKFSAEPRVVFLGWLDAYWVNVRLLQELCDLYEFVDIWGGPPPRGRLRSHYRGYAPTLDVLAEYQLGLVTITDDPLRRRSFSSKQLEYGSYGLPVLTPAWRKDSLLDGYSIPYTADTFLDAVRSATVPETWERLSASAIGTTAGLSWEHALRELALHAQRGKTDDRFE